MSEETKAMKFRAAFQVKELVHLHATIQSTPLYRNDLENCMAFVGEQMRSLRQQNGTPTNRNLSSFNRSNNNGNKSKSKYKSPHKKWTNPKHKKSSKRDKPATAYDPNNPGQYVTKSAWARMTDAEKQASRDARNTEDRRNLQSVTTAGATTGADATLNATVVDLTRRLDAITAQAQASADSTDAPPPLQPILRRDPRYSIA